jgi:membrane fusion protein (multidrug efflux system)
MNYSATFAFALILLMPGCRKQSGGGPPPGMAISVVTAPAARKPVTERLSLVGTLLANEVVEIKSEVDGRVEKLGFDDGQVVKEGHLLVQLDDTKFAAALAQAEANHKLAQSTLKRQEELLERKVVSAQEFDQAASAYQANEAAVTLRRRELKDSRMHAPFDGMLSARMVSPGQFIMKGTPLATLVALDPVKVEFSVPERFIGQLRTGQTVDLRVAAFPSEGFRGEVYFIAPQVDPILRTATVRAQIANPDHKLRPGMFASLDLTLKVRAAAIVVPEPALMHQGERVMVYIVDAESKAQLRPVRPGLRLDGWVEIVEGLKEGEAVIVEGHQKARPGGDVNVAEPAAPPPGQPPAEAQPASH